MDAHKHNYDPAEQAHFDALASSWWDPEGESRPLHELNPARVRFIKERATLKDAVVTDIGCGGGILCEALATLGAHVIGIDISSKALEVARLHLHESGLSVDYQQSTAELWAEQHSHSTDILTCLEMLEHVPDPASVISACADILKPGGDLFLSTLNRTAKSFAVAIVGAEHLMRLLPKGTHRYDRFIKPSELSASLRQHDFDVLNITGLHYNPLTRSTRLGGSVDVNYLVHARKRLS